MVYCFETRSNYRRENILYPVLDLVRFEVGLIREVDYLKLRIVEADVHFEWRIVHEGLRINSRKMDKSIKDIANTFTEFIVSKEQFTPTVTEFLIVDNNSYGSITFKNVLFHYIIHIFHVWWLWGYEWGFDFDFRQPKVALY